MAHDCKVLLRWLSDSSDPQLLAITATSLRDLASAPASKSALLQLKPLPTLCAAIRKLAATNPSTACVLGRVICEFVSEPSAAEALLQEGASSILLQLLAIADQVHEWALSSCVVQLAAIITPKQLTGLLEGELSSVVCMRPSSFLQGRAVGLWLLAALTAQQGTVVIIPQLAAQVARKLRALTAALDICPAEHELQDVRYWCTVAATGLQIARIPAHEGPSDFSGWLIAHCLLLEPEAAQYIDYDALCMVLPHSVTALVAAHRACTESAELETEHMTLLVPTLARALKHPPKCLPRASERWSADSQVAGGCWADELNPFVMAASSIEALLRNGAPIGLPSDAIEVLVEKVSAVSQPAEHILGAWRLLQLCDQVSLWQRFESRLLGAFNGTSEALRFAGAAPRGWTSIAAEKDSCGTLQLIPEESLRLHIQVLTTVLEQPPAAWPCSPAGAVAMFGVVGAAHVGTRGKDSIVASVLVLSGIDASAMTRVVAVAAIGMIAHRAKDDDGDWLEPATEAVLAALAVQPAPTMLLQLVGLGALCSLHSVPSVQVTSSWIAAAARGLLAKEWKIRAVAAQLVTALFRNHSTAVEKPTCTAIMSQICATQPVERSHMLQAAAAMVSAPSSSVAIVLAPAVLIPAARSIAAILSATNSSTESLLAAAGAVVGAAHVLGIPMCSILCDTATPRQLVKLLQRAELEEVACEALLALHRGADLGATLSAAQLLLLREAPIQCRDIVVKQAIKDLGRAIKGGDRSVQSAGGTNQSSAPDHVCGDETLQMLDSLSEEQQIAAYNHLKQVLSSKGLL